MRDLLDVDLSGAVPGDALVIDTDGETITLARARLCLYWSRDVKGFMGLAANGPSTKCRIGPAADITLRAITAVLEVTPEAVTKWEAAPWAA